MHSARVDRPLAMFAMFRMFAMFGCSSALAINIYLQLWPAKAVIANGKMFI